MTQKSQGEYERHGLFEYEIHPRPIGAVDVCILCGTHVKCGGRTNNVLGKSSHIAMHIRNGDLVEETRTRVEHYTVYIPQVSVTEDSNALS